MKQITLILLAALTPAIYSSELSEKNFKAQIVGSGYEALNGQIAEIAGDANAIWGDDNLPKLAAKGVWAIRNYLKIAPSSAGKVYYGKVDGLGYCFHESWLKRDYDPTENNEHNDLNQSYVSEDGTVYGPRWFVEAMGKKPRR